MNWPTNNIDINDLPPDVPIRVVFKRDRLSRTGLISAYAADLPSGPAIVSWEGALSQVEQANLTARADGIQTLQGDMGHTLYGAPADAVQARTYLEHLGRDRIYTGPGVTFRREEGTRNYVPWHRASR